jgi:hypothetical protein
MLSSHIHGILQRRKSRRGRITMENKTMSVRIVARVFNNRVLVGYRCLNELTGEVFNLEHEKLISLLKDGATSGTFGLSNGERVGETYTIYDGLVRNLPVIDYASGQVIKNDLVIVLGGMKVEKKLACFLVTDSTGALQPITLDKAYGLYHSVGMFNMRFKGKKPTFWGKMPIIDYDNFVRGNYLAKDRWGTTITQRAIMRRGNKG